MLCNCDVFHLLPVGGEVAAQETTSFFLEGFHKWPGLVLEASKWPGSSEMARNGLARAWPEMVCEASKEFCFLYTSRGWCGLARVWGGFSQQPDGPLARPHPLSIRIDAPSI